MSRSAPRSFADNRWSDDLTHWHVVVADGRDVGCVWVERCVAEETVADLGIFLAGEADRGRGIGRQALELAKHAAIARWRLHTLRLRVRETNSRAIACYRAVGFEAIGRSEKTIEGERIGIWEMALQLKAPS